MVRPRLIQLKIFAILTIIESSKTKERFPDEVLAFCGRKRFSDRGHLPTKARNEHVHGQLFYELSRTPIWRLNWTETYTTSLTSGHYDEHGNYSGLLGMIQRDEIDYAFQVVQSDAVVSDKIYLGPAVFSASAYKISKTPKFKEIEAEIMDIIEHFDTQAWVYLGIISILLIAICCLMYIALKSEIFTADDDNVQASKLNAMMYESVISIDEGKKTMISETVFWDLISRRMFCGLNATKIISITVSKPFNEGVLGLFFNSRLPKAVIRYLDYQTRNAVEYAVMSRRVVAVAQYLVSLHFSDDYKTLRCIHQLKDGELDDFSFEAENLKPYHNTFVWSAYGIAVDRSRLGEVDLRIW
ncbi:hypothetical protein HDE_07822 [Halotydeus destructor]|nr:hypothetical protein HDE_07822 [Halotydeus destructor]